jgi:hypothetical protein
MALFGGTRIVTLGKEEPVVRAVGDMAVRTDIELRMDVFADRREPLCIIVACVADPVLFVAQKAFFIGGVRGMAARAHVVRNVGHEVAVNLVKARHGGLVALCTESDARPDGFPGLRQVAGGAVSLFKGLVKVGLEHGRAVRGMGAVAAEAIGAGYIVAGVQACVLFGPCLVAFCTQVLSCPDQEPQPVGCVRRVAGGAIALGDLRVDVLSGKEFFFRMAFKASLAKKLRQKPGGVGGVSIVTGKAVALENGFVYDLSGKTFSPVVAAVTEFFLSKTEEPRMPRYVRVVARRAEPELHGLVYVLLLC